MQDRSIEREKKLLGTVDSATSRSVSFESFESKLKLESDFREISDCELLIFSAVPASRMGADFLGPLNRHDMELDKLDRAA